MQDEMQLLKLNVVFIMVMCKMNIDKVTTTEKDVTWEYLHIGAGTYMCVCSIHRSKRIVILGDYSVST